MTEELIFAGYAIFRAPPGRLPDDRDVIAKEASTLFEDFGGVETRGIYSLSGLKAGADLMFWWVARSIDDLQDVTVAFRKTELGRNLDLRDVLIGLVRPAEFSKEHRPAFVKGEPPKRYVCVYPFVRTPDWYLLDPAERGRLLREHGEAGRQFPDVLANTTSAFGLGDYEWILAFEADTPDRIVDLIRHLRGTEARRYTKVEVPFFTGVRKDLSAAVGDLP